MDIEERLAEIERRTTLIAESWARYMAGIEEERREWREDKARVAEARHKERRDYFAATALNGLLHADREHSTDGLVERAYMLAAAMLAAAGRR